MLTASSAASTPRRAVEILLGRDPLRHIVPLKLLHTHGDAMTCRYAESEGAGAALLLLPTVHSVWDAAQYPDAGWVALLAADGRAAADQLLAGLPAGRMVFKLAGTIERAALLNRYAARRTTAFISFTASPSAIYPAHEDLLVTATPEEHWLAIFAEHGHDAELLARACAAGEGLLFAAMDGGILASLCFATRIYESIWEIGGLSTTPELRRRGHARRLIELALYMLAERRLTPRYQVQEDNLPSIRLAESAGLRPFVTVEHYLVEVPARV